MHEVEPQPTDMAERRIVLHAGARKTGSTAIQGFLAANRAWLGDRGVHVVGTASGDANHWRVLSTDRYFHTELCSEIAALGSDIHTVVFSSESVILKSPRGLARVRRVLDEACGERSPTTVVVYLRNSVAHAQSVMLQHLRNGEIEPRVIKELNRPLSRIDPAVLRLLMSPWVTVDFEARIHQVERFLMPDRVVPRLYVRSRFPGGDVVSDFLEVLGVAPDGREEVVGSDTNRSLCVEAAWILDEAFPEVVDCAARDTLVRTLCDYDGPGRSTRFLRPATSAIVAGVHAEAHRRLVHRFPQLEGLLAIDLPFGAAIEAAAIERCREFVEGNLALRGDGT